MKETLNTIALLGAIGCGAVLFWSIYDLLRAATKYLSTPHVVNHTVTINDKVAEELKRMLSL